jgi:hypothetical protein
VLAASTGYVVFTGLLPFVVLFGFWIFLMRNVRTRMPTQYQPLVDKLEEIRAELECLRKSVGDRDQDPLRIRLLVLVLLFSIWKTEYRRRRMSGRRESDPRIQGGNLALCH